MSTIITQFFDTVEQAPDQTALIFADIEISYSKLSESVRRLAAALGQRGITKGDRVAIMLPNVPHFVISYYAILAAGAIAVPINFIHTEAEIEHQLNDSGAKLLILWQGFYHQIDSIYPQMDSCNDLLILGERIPSSFDSLTQTMATSEILSQPVQGDETDIAAINYTSGISDWALGAAFSHAAVASNAATCVDMFRISPQDRLIAVLPLFHPLGQTLVMHATLSTGAALLLLPRFQAEEVIRSAQNHHITIMPAVPGMFRAFNRIENLETVIPGLKFCMSYGGHLPNDILQEFENRYNTTILKAYGLTEAGPLVSCTRMDHDRKPESVGLPLMGVEVQIRDKSGQILRPNHTGEIFVKSAGVMSGYWQQPQETQNRLQNGWLATGDVGYLDFDHYLHIQERKDDIILKGGFEIHSREVERILLEHPTVDEAAVVSVADAVQGSEVKAYIVLKPNLRSEPQELINYCQTQLPLYKCPRYIEFVDALPKTPTGRILKRYLRQGLTTLQMGEKKKQV